MCPTVRDARRADRAAASGPDTRPVLRPERRAADPNETAQAVWRRVAGSHHTYLTRSPSRATLTFPTTAFIPFLDALEESAKEL